MFKTVWSIEIDGNDKVEFTYYHFGRMPQFPKWYMEEGHYYTIEMIWNFKLIPTLRSLMKCLFHEYIIK